VAGTLALVLVLGLAGLTFGMRAAGPMLPKIPAAVTARTAGLAPGLLAALVAIELTGPNGVIQLDVKIPAVVVAGALAILRVPFIACVIAGALTAAGLRALFHLN